MTLSQQKPAATELAAGDCVGRYHLLYPVARGGMGSIWCARLQDLTGPFDRLFAVKVLLPQLAEDETLRAMLLDEGRIAASIVHTNVAQVSEVGESTAGVYLAIEWVDGDSLQNLHRTVLGKGDRLPYGITLRILADACAGLHAAHELRDPKGERLEVVHRDISPQNILVSSTGVVKLIDFGIAKARGRLQSDTSLGTVKGKFRYMAPEQAGGGRIDRRADIWSMGATLQYLVTGRPPYAEENEAATIYALVNGAPREPVAKSVPLAIREIIARALEYEPSRRFPTALAMQGALEAAAQTLDQRTTGALVADYYAVHMSDRIDARRHALQDAVTERLQVGAATERTGIRRSSGSIKLASKSQGDTAVDRVAGVMQTAANLALGDARGIAAPPRRPSASLVGGLLATTMVVALALWGVVATPQTRAIPSAPVVLAPVLGPSAPTPQPPSSSAAPAQAPLGVTPAIGTAASPQPSARQATTGLPRPSRPTSHRRAPSDPELTAIDSRK